MNPKSIISLYKTAGLKIEMFGDRLAVSPASCSLMNTGA